MAQAKTDHAGAAEHAAAALAEHTGVAEHEVALVLGSGWLPAIERLGRTVADVPLAELPGFDPPNVPGQGGSVRSLDVGGRPTLVFLGRTHYYEGRGIAAVAHGVRTAAAAGVKSVVLTNAAGGLRPGMQVGDAVLIADHLNLTWHTPLLGPQFIDMTEAYSVRLRDLVRSIDPSITEGVYAMFPGPQFETPAEVRMAGILGADLVGMSTVMETIAARAEGLDVLGISLVTNLAAGLGEKLDHEEVLEAGRNAAARMGRLLAELVPQL